MKTDTKRFVPVRRLVAGSSVAVLLLVFLVSKQSQPSAIAQICDDCPCDPTPVAPCSWQTPTPVLQVPTPTVKGVRDVPPSSPHNATYFLVNFPFTYKPNLTGNYPPMPPATTPTRNPIGAIIYNAVVDHNPPFYDYADRRLIPYTGEVAIVPTAAPTGPGAYGVTATGRRYYYNSHSGLDLHADTGRPVYAAHAGVVHHANETAGSSYQGYGFAVMLKDAENPGFYTLYAHLSDVIVSEGDRLARGQQVGYTGSTGAGTGAHFHFGVYQGGVYDTRHDEAQSNVLDPNGWFSYTYDPLRQRTPGPNEFKGLPPDYKWTSGYPPGATTNQPQNWNLGVVIGNQYVDKSRGRPQNPAAIGAPPTGATPTVHPLERWWTNNYGSPGAPYGALNLPSPGCQFFEGGTACVSGDNVNYDPHYQDVPIEHWAHRYIGWVNAEHIAAGYPCGGTNPQTLQPEPCVNGKSYFRPESNMTRGQYAKVVSEMMGFTVDPGPQIYEDVGPDTPFYVWINRLTRAEIMSGYRCGEAPAGPCVAPNNRPYFQYGSDVTRGQASKILAGAGSMKGWLNVYSTDDGPDFWDVDRANTFYPYIQRLYKAGVVPSRLEEQGRAGQGGTYHVGRVATRAELVMFLHELVYATIPYP